MTPKQSRRISHLREILKDKDIPFHYKRQENSRYTLEIDDANPSYVERALEEAGVDREMLRDL